MSSLLQQSASEAILSQAGLKGGVIITDTSVITGNFRIIQVLADTVFTTLTANHTTNGDSTQSVAADYGTLLSGMVIFGKFTAITLASGRVIAYK